MSGTKKIEKTLTTASKLPSEYSRAVMSACRNSTLSRPAASAFVRACSSKREAKSTPTTNPFFPTACAAGNAEAPVPQPTSSTFAPSCNFRLVMVRLPIRSQKPSGSSSKWSARHCSSQQPSPLLSSRGLPLGLALGKCPEPAQFNIHHRNDRLNDRYWIGT